MAKTPPKHGRDHNLDFEGFLNNLQDWELSLKDNEKKLKSQSIGKEKLNTSGERHGVRNARELSSGFGTNGIPTQSKEQRSRSSQVRLVGEDRRPIGNPSAVINSNTASQYDYLRNYDAVNNLSTAFMAGESFIDANSEKELGNENFKQKKFKEAVDCYSRSIALSPTAVAYANRAMAYLKLKRFQEADDDCTEALNLDDRYIKAYSRRSTARKELRKFKESIEDAEFALRLEPHNQEIKKQYAEAKSLYEKEIFQKASGALEGSVQEVQQSGRPVTEMNGHDHSVQSIKSNSESTIMAAMDKVHIKKSQRTGKEQLKPSVQELAARAASLARAEAAKNITPPNTAYQFEVSWRRFSGDRTLQAQLLKVTPPTALPEIFKNALSAPILIEIIRCIATFFNEEIDLSVKYLLSLTKVSRFDIIIMCLSSADKAEIVKIWDNVFLNNRTPAELVETLSMLRPRYCPVR